MWENLRSLMEAALEKRDTMIRRDMPALARLAEEEGIPAVAPPSKVAAPEGRSTPRLHSAFSRIIFSGG